jgi:hypothetical protein
MEAELVLYAKEALALHQGGAGTNEGDNNNMNATCDVSIVSIEDRRTSFDGVAAKQTIAYVRDGILEIGKEVAGGKLNPFHCGVRTDEDDEDESSQASGCLTPLESSLSASGSSWPTLPDLLVVPTETTPLVRASM